MAKSTDLDAKRAEYDRLLAMMQKPAENYIADELRDLVALDDTLAALIIRFEAAKARQIVDLNRCRVLGRELGCDPRQVADVANFVPQGHASRALSVARGLRREKAFAAGDKTQHGPPEYWLIATPAAAKAQGI